MLTKLAIVASHPIQYWAPVYRLLARDKNIDLKVFYVGENGAEEYFDREFNQLVKWDRPLTEGYQYEFLRPGHKLDNFSFFTVDAKNIDQALVSFQPDFLLINGYGHRVNWRSLRADVADMRVIYISDSNAVDARASWKTIIKKVFLRLFFQHVDYFLTTSPRNRQYLIEHNADSSKFIKAPLPTDIKWFAKQKERLSDDQVDHLRKKLEIPQNNKIILFAGKLIPHKRPADVVHLMHELRREKVSAIIVGSGELKDSLIALTEELGLSSNIVFAGFVNQSDLAEYFSLADMLIFPSSREPFGLIASEVLPFGLPIIAADNIGAIGASIRDGANALLYPSGDIPALLTQVQKVLANPSLFNQLSASSIELSKEYDTSVLVDVIVAICKGKQV